jgi:hypothetical protein
MRIDIKKTMAIILCLATMALLFGCGPSAHYLNQKKQGLLPDTGNFPNTKWTCRELDMYLYMFGYRERYMVGTYKVDGVSYRVVATFEFDTFNFEIYSSTQISESEHSPAMVHCDQIFCGFIYTNYKFDKKTETFICSLRNTEPVHKETIPDTLTFYKSEDIAQNSSMRWYAQELDLYLDSFIDVDCYFRGQISIDGERCYVHAFEIGNNSFFALSIENEKVNTSISGTTSLLIRMYFEINENQIIAKVSDEYIANTEMFPYWPYGDVIITFKPHIPQ